MTGVLIAIACLVLTTGLASAKGGEELTVIPTSLYQEALRWQVMAPGIEVPQVELLLLWSRALTDEDVERLKEAGYGVQAVTSAFVRVSAPITLYIDSDKGLDALGSVRMALPDVGQGVNPVAGMGQIANLENLGTQPQSTSFHPEALNAFRAVQEWLMQQGLPVPE